MDRRYVGGKKPVCSSPARGASGQGRLNLLYHDQGLPSYDADSYYGRSDRARYMSHELEGPSRFENLEISRADLLRKLDELKDHLSRSCEVTERPRQRMNADMMVSPVLRETYPRTHAAYVQEGSTTSHGVTKQSLAPDDMVYSYLNQAPGFVPYTHPYGSGLRDFHLHRGYNYPQEMPQGPYGQPQSQHLHQHCHERCNGYCGNVNQDLFVLNREFQRPTCSCVHCFDKNWDLPVSPSYPYGQRAQHVLSNPYYHHHPLPVVHGPQGFNSGGFNLPTSSSSQPSITPKSTELEFGNDGIHQNFARKREEAHRNVHMLHPIAGGAPFVACSSCFELLKLPRKHISSAKRRHKLKCGACSSIILFELENKASTLPVSGSVGHLVTEPDDCSSVKVDDNGYEPGGSNYGGSDACSDSNDDSIPKVSPAQNKSSSGELEKQLDPPSVSSLSENLQTPNTLSSEKHVSTSAELNAAEVESIPYPVLSTDECPDHCSANIVADHCDAGNKDTKSELDHAVAWQNSVGDSAVSTEIDMSSKEFPKSFVSQDPVDKVDERDLRDDKGAESSTTGHVRNSSADLLKLAENVEVGTSQVFVNWHLIPEHLVEKAELLAGPIEPGDYWYDIRAGFWGVMGYPCLGIIMPNIEEFNYPMPVNCAAGNTEVFVNGRELHQKDLDLLAARGLPETRQRSYLIEISGEVIDEDTGEELDSIGRLAPTVERAKHGFGMKVPRFIARLQEQMGLLTEFDTIASCYCQNLRG